MNNESTLRIPSVPASKNPGQPPCVGNGIKDAGSFGIPQWQADMHHAQRTVAHPDYQDAFPEASVASGLRKASPVLGGDDHDASYSATVNGQVGWREVGESE